MLPVPVCAVCLCVCGGILTAQWFISFFFFMRRIHRIQNGKTTLSLSVIGNRRPGDVARVAHTLRACPVYALNHAHTHSHVLSCDGTQDIAMHVCVCVRLRFGRPKKRNQHQCRINVFAVISHRDEIRGSVPTYLVGQWGGVYQELDWLLETAVMVNCDAEHNFYTLMQSSFFFFL